MTIASRAFGNRESIPARHTCEGEDLSPPLDFSGIPEGTKSLVLLVDDPDAPDPAAPQRVWVHWIVYNLPPDTPGLPEGASSRGLPEGAQEGVNDSGEDGYGGPCPPIGEHRYFHRLFALDRKLPDLGAVKRDRLEREMEGHVLATAELVGVYQCSR